jgi:hypothetical protein
MVDMPYTPAVMLQLHLQMQWLQVPVSPSEDCRQQKQIDVKMVTASSNAFQSTLACSAAGTPCKPLPLTAVTAATW